MEYIKPDKLDAGTTIKGLDYIDIPGLATRDYKLTFHSHKECQPLIKVCLLTVYLFALFVLVLLQ